MQDLTTEANRMARLTILVSDAPGGSLDARVKGLLKRLPSFCEQTIVYHQGRATGRIGRFVSALRTSQPDMIYVLDPIYAAVCATRLYTLVHHPKLIVDTGDLVYELAKELGKIGPLGLAIVRWAEQMALRRADCVIVRSTFHRDLLEKQGHHQVKVIPDGVDPDEFYPTGDSSWRRRFGLSDADIVVGGIGSMHWNDRRQTCFGWDLVEAMALLRDVPIKGLLIGDGDGKPQLEARAQELGIADRLVFAGHVPYTELQAAVNALDICLLTQTNDQIAWVRTTGKLPIYLACDRYVIATEVGEAARLLKPFDMLLPYAGSGRDDHYPLRLAEKIRRLAQQPEQLQLNGRGVAIARRYFDYNTLAQSLQEILGLVLIDYQR